MTCLRQQQRTLIPLPGFCPPAAWPPAPTVSHSGSSCPRSLLHWIFKLCALPPLPGAVFQTQGSSYFFAKMGRQNQPVLDRKKRKRKGKKKRNEIVTADCQGSLVFLVASNDSFPPMDLICLWLWCWARRQPMRIAKVQAVCLVLPLMSSHHYACFSCLLVLGLSVRHPHCLAPANGSCRTVQRQT